MQGWGGGSESNILNFVIISEDKSSKEQIRSIISYFDEAGRLLKGWIDKTAEMYPNEPELLEQLSVPKYVTVTILIGGMVSHGVVPAPDGTIYLVDINETHYWGSN